MGGPFEDPIIGTQEMFQKPGLLFFCIAAAVAVLVLNLASMTAVRLVSAVFKTVWGTMNTISIWLFSILFGLEAFDPKTAMI